MRQTSFIILLLTCCAAWGQPRPAAKSKLSRIVDNPVRDVSNEELSELLRSGQYVHVAPDVLNELLKRYQASRNPSESPVRRARYHATLSEAMLQDGTLTLDLGPAESRVTTPVRLGQTNLNNMQLFSDHVRLTLAADAQGNLLPLVAPTSLEIRGNWSLAGERNGATTVFHLKLPDASIADFHLRTEAGAGVASVNALVVAGESTDEWMDWTLFPRDPSVLSITCTRPESLQGQSEAIVGLSTDVSVEVPSTHLTWQMTVPRYLGKSRLWLLLTEDCAIESVQAAGAELSWSQNRQKGSLTVNVPELNGTGTISVQAVVDRMKSAEVKLPFLLPETWQPAGGGSEGKTEVRFGRFRMTVVPELLVTDLELAGILETDVSTTAGGVRSLNLSQFSRRASARVMLAPANPVITDSVVTRLSSGRRANTATAFVYVEPVAGTTAQLFWKIPRPWRVTDVHESAGGLPLLFRMHDTAELDGGDAQVDIILRNPVSRDSGLGLTVIMQSTAPQSSTTVALPGLVNPDYHRQLDLICPAVGTPAEDFSWVVPQLLTTAPDVSWLPAEIGDSEVFLKRPAHSYPSQPSVKNEDEIFSTVEYSVVTETSEVVESLRLRLRTTGTFPADMKLHFTPDAEVYVSDESLSQPAPMLRKLRKDVGYDVWELTLPSALQSSSEIDVTIQSRRPLAEKMIATLVAVPEARLSGGTVHPPAAESQVLLLNQETVTESYQYPPVPFDDEWVIAARGTSQDLLATSSTAFVLIQGTGEGERPVAEVVQQIAMTSSDGHEILSVRLPNVTDQHVYVNNRLVYADRQGDRLLIPLQNRASDTLITIVWTIPVNAPDIQLSLGECAAAVSRPIQCFVLTPPGFGVHAADEFTLRPADEVTSLLTTACRHPDGMTVPDRVSAFQTRWRLASVDTRSIACRQAIDTGHDAQVIEITLRDGRFDLSWTLCWSVLIVVLWQVTDREKRTRRWGPAIVLLLFSLCPQGINPLPSSLNGGIVWGTLVVAVATLLHKAVSRLVVRKPEHRRSAAGLQLTGILFVAAAGNFLSAQEPADKAMVLKPSSQSGETQFLYVENGFLTELRKASSTGTHQALVISSDVTVTMESPQSCLLKIQCLVACDPATVSRLSLPLTGMTLIKATLDGKSVFPVRRDDGSDELIIRDRNVLPPPFMLSGQESGFSPGPNVFGDWDLRTVEYTTRGVPRRSPGAFHISSSLPHAATSVIRLIDKSGLVEQVGTTAVPDIGRRSADGVWTVPALQNSGLLDLLLGIDERAELNTTQQQQTSVVCVADVSPARQRIVCAYRITPSDSRFDKVVIGTDPEYRITHVETSGGDPLTWNLDGTELHVNVVPDEDGIQSLVLQLVHEPATSLVHQLPIGAISQVNGRHADFVALLADPSDRFVVSSVTADEQIVNDVPITDDVRTFGIVGTSDRMNVVPRASRVLELQLAEVQATRVASVTQSVDVSDTTIDWRGRFDIDVSGQPVFRHSMRLSPELRVFDVQARSDGVSLLQSWTRREDQVVVALREAARGILELEVHGVIKRLEQKDTSLPVIQLSPSTQITEMVLDLSASSETDTFIRDTGGSDPVDAIDVSTDPIPPAPWRFNVADESRPITIQSIADKLIKAEVAAFVYEVGGETRIAQFLSLLTPAADFDIRFSCAPAEFGDVTPLLIQGADVETITNDGSGFVIPRNRQVEMFVLGFPELATDIEVGEISCRVPRFESRIDVTNVSVFDTRNGQSSPVLSPTPQWAFTAASQVGIPERSSRGIRLDARFVAESRRIQIQVEPGARAPEIVTGSDGLYRIHSQHVVRTADNGSVLGESGFLIFQTRERTQELNIPRSVSVAEIRVNGKPVAIRATHGSASIRVPNGIAFVRVTWLDNESVDSVMVSRFVALPGFRAPQGSATAVVVAPSARPFLWSVANAQSPSEILNARHIGFRRGIELLNGTGGSLATSSSVAVSAVQEAELWQQISQLSPEAGSAARAFFQATDHESTGGAALVDPGGANKVAFEFTSLPSQSRSLPFFAGLVILTVTWLTSRAARPSLDASVSTKK